MNLEDLTNNISKEPSLESNDNSNSTSQHEDQIDNILEDPIIGHYIETFFITRDELAPSSTYNSLPLDEDDSLLPTVDDLTARSIELDILLDSFKSFRNVSNQQHSPTPPPKRQKTSSEQCNYKNSKCQNPSVSDVIVNKQKPRTRCNCKKTTCSNGYCPCHRAKVQCSDLCRCKDCNNNNHGTGNGDSVKKPAYINDRYNIKDKIKERM